MAKYVVFDLDGTLLDTLEDLTDSLNHALSEYGYPARSFEDVRRFVGNGADMLIVRAMTDYEGMLSEKDLCVFEGLHKCFKEHYAKNCNNKTKPYPGITCALKDLKGRGKKLAIVSNKPHGAVGKLSELYFKGLIDVAVGDMGSKSGTAGLSVRKKPAPDSVYMALRAMANPDEMPGISTVGADILKEAVYVGDSEVDIETARNTGLKCISVTWGFRDKEYLKSMGAEITVDNAEKLQEMLTNL